MDALLTLGALITETIKPEDFLDMKLTKVELVMPTKLANTSFPFVLQILFSTVLLNMQGHFLKEVAKDVQKVQKEMIENNEFINRSIKILIIEKAIMEKNILPKENIQ